MGLTGVFKWQVSEMAQTLDPIGEDFPFRPLDAGPYRAVWRDALVIKCREGGPVDGAQRWMAQISVVARDEMASLTAPPSTSISHVFTRR